MLRGILARALNEPELIRRLLSAPGTWAVVGCSPDPSRDSHRIAALLQRRGHRVVPVNPGVAPAAVLGERSFSSLGEIPPEVEVDVVDIFRRSEQAGTHVAEAIERRARAVWMQLGVIDHAAAERAQAAGLGVVMDRCPAVEYERLA